MHAPSAQIVPTLFSLAAVFAWGTSDFLGGYASRRANAFVLSAIAHASGLLLMLSIAGISHAPFPARASVAWAFVAGVSGGLGLGLFYRALASGRMGLTAPVAAVLGAAIPTAVGILTEGAPSSIHISGFLLAGLGIWLISRAGDSGPSGGVTLAAISGVGFAGFYICIHQAGNASAVWMAAFSRTGALAIATLIVFATQTIGEIAPAEIRWGILAGCLDVSGTAFFVRASQTGRLDAAVVLTSLYPAVTVLLARLFLNEHFTKWRALGILTALVAVPLIAS